MIPEFFTQQMGKVTRVFGKEHYPEPRMKTIWIAVKDLSEEWFEKLVNSMITQLRQAPLPIEFMEAARKERRKGQDTWSLMEQDEYKRRYQHIFTEEDRAEFFEVLRKLGTGEMSPAEGKQYAAVVQSTIDEHKKGCAICARL